MMFILKVIFLLIPFTVSLLGLIMLLPHRLPIEIQNQILKNGLIHLTSKESAEKIISAGAVKTSRHNNHTYFFQNGVIKA